MSTKSTTCRRCGECRSNSHHWLENTTDPGDDITARIPTHICKHCDQQGQECPACGGGGIDTETLSGLCRFCRGEGVIPFDRYEQLADLSGEAAREILDQRDGWEAEAGRQAQQHQAPVEAIVMQARIAGVVERALIEFWKRRACS